MKTISRVLPFYNLTKTIKLPNGVPKHAHVRVLEVAFFDAYKVSKLAEETLKMQRPKHIRFKKDGKKLVCACTYHVNIDHLRKALNNLLSVNNELIITDNVDLRFLQGVSEIQEVR